MRDEDVLKKALATGKVSIGGKDFAIDPAKAGRVLAGGSDYTNVKHNNFASGDTPDLFVPTKKARKSYQDDDRPEVALREGIRAAIRGGLSREKIKEIFEHELVFGVMGS